MHQLTEAMVTYTRPIQDEDRWKSVMDGEGNQDISPLTEELLAVHGYCERKYNSLCGIFTTDRLLRSQWIVTHQNVYL